ncbi:MAG: hypothetical protein L6V84_00075 [Oscillospiraceae bacterium]|nr:MAG: hypothetical protein L6V84_00075 [Oscillospiraceae bacterium]
MDSKTELYAPIEKLTFAPSGSDEFSVSGTVVINGKNYSCNVVRKVTDGVNGNLPDHRLFPL